MRNAMDQAHPGPRLPGAGIPTGLKPTRVRPDGQLGKGTNNTRQVGANSIIRQRRQKALKRMRPRIPTGKPRQVPRQGVRQRRPVTPHLRQELRPHANVLVRFTIKNDDRRSLRPASPDGRHRNKARRRRIIDPPRLGPVDQPTTPHHDQRVEPGRQSRNGFNALKRPTRHTIKNRRRTQQHRTPQVSLQQLANPPGFLLTRQKKCPCSPARQ